MFLGSQALVPAYATTYTMTLHTDASSYSGSQPIHITGSVSPAPGPNTGVIITIKNSANGLADVTEVAPSSTTGSFNYTSVPGGSAAWITGSYSVNATWGGDGATASQVVTFSYTATTTTSTTSTTTTTTSSTSSTTSATSTTSTTSATTTTSQTSTTSSTSTTTSSTVPEFPSGALALLALAGLAFAAAMSRRLARPSAALR